MAPTEMIQVGLPLHSPRPASPPKTPTMSDEDANEILATMKMHPTSPNPHYYRSEMLPFALQFLEVLKSVNSTQSPPAAPVAAGEVKAEDPQEMFQTYKTVNEVWDEKAYKYVIEEQHQPEDPAAETFPWLTRYWCSWDEKAYKYVIEEQQQPEGKVDGLDRYVFIERRRI
ncbi:hypothetical protein V501_00281, partial [Pseudogymnoascus sp. VKM F-4519 (FW-2642)]